MKTMYMKVTRQHCTRVYVLVCVCFFLCMTNSTASRVYCVAIVDYHIHHIILTIGYKSFPVSSGIVRECIAASNESTRYWNVLIHLKCICEAVGCRLLATNCFRFVIKSYTHTVWFRLVIWKNAKQQKEIIHCAASEYVIESENRINFKETWKN